MKLSRAQEDLLAEIKFSDRGRVQVSGRRLQTADALQRRGLVEVKVHGTPWRKGWYYYAVAKESS